MDSVLTKYCEKSNKGWISAFFPFPTMLSKAFFWVNAKIVLFRKGFTLLEIKNDGQIMISDKFILFRKILHLKTRSA